jgi:2-oxoglutarate dehydrogenase E2 component (dihydrolipoamide succinyltransferase)
MLTTFNEIDMTAVQEVRARHGERFQEAHGVSLGLTSFFARACAQALKQFPNVNAQIDNGDILFHDYVNLGIAVSTERGLIVPVLRHIENASLAQIETEIKRAAGAARDGKLSISDLSGGTFTITNGGVFGSLLSTPLLNPPQAGILGLHAILDRPVAIQGQVEIRPMMYVALTYDHRLVDGKESVSFLVRVKQLIEDPLQMILEI